MLSKHEILYVENDIDFGEVISALSEFDHFDFRMVRTSDEAKVCLSEADFDILIIESKSRKISGIELLKWCRLRGKHLPVIMLTNTKTLPKLEEEALQDCCTSILVKPFSFDNLVSAMEAALARRHDFECKGQIYQPGKIAPLGAFP